MLIDHQIFPPHVNRTIKNTFDLLRLVTEMKIKGSNLLNVTSHDNDVECRKVQNDLFPPASGASWGILNRYWLDPDKNGKSPKCFANFHRLPEVTRQKEGYF